MMRRVGDFLHFLAHLLTVISLAIIGANLVKVVGSSETINCGYARDYLPDWGLVGVGIAGLLGGRFVNKLDTPKPQAATATSTLAAQFALACAFSMLVGIWVIEAIGTSHAHATAAPEFNPLTWYVRCAIYHDYDTSMWSFGPWSPIGPWTTFVAFVISYVTGHWLWSYHPILRTYDPCSDAGAEVRIPVGTGEVFAQSRPKEIEIT